ncbi:MAG TPA: hypothetical protein VGI88_07700 [Verrucomicrobiae bacterium]
MRKVWPFIYLIGAAFSFIGGYRSLAQERTVQTNADWILVTITFIMMCLFPLGAMAYSRRRWRVEVFRRPSLDRHPIGWWRDTLQPIRVSWVSMGLFCLGSCFALPKANNEGVMLFWFYAAGAVGMFLGERIVYKVYGNLFA